MINIWLDDERPIGVDFPADAILCKTVGEAIDAIVANGYNIGMISFDHDLGDHHRTGYDLACWIEQKVHEGVIKPFHFRVHSQNPVGRERIKSALRSIMLKWKGYQA